MGVIEGLQQFIAKVWKEVTICPKEFKDIDDIMEFVSDSMNATLDGKWKDQTKKMIPNIKTGEVQLKLFDNKTNYLTIASPISFLAREYSC